MKDAKLIILDGIKWWDTVSTENTRLIVPLCLQHNLRLNPVLLTESYYSGNTRRSRYLSSDKSVQLRCEESDGHILDIPRKYSVQRKYVMDKIDAQIFSKMATLNLDGELTPVAKAKDKSDEYFTTAQIMESKNGPQLVIYAGKKGHPGKTQIFIDPTNKKMSFDHKDIKPTDTFLQVKATFDDGSSQELKK